MTTTTNSRPSFLLYKSFYAPVKHLKDDELGLLFRALFDYQNDLEVTNLPPQVGMAFAFFKNQFDLDGKKYQETCSENSRNAKLRWEKNKTIRADATACEGIRTDANDADKEKETDKDKEEDKDLKKKPKGFVRPTFQEVQDYCQERKNSVSAQKWINHYESNGWKVGKNSMKDWKAAVRKWEEDKPTNQDPLVNNLNQIAGGNYFQSVVLGDVAKITCMAGMKTKAYSLPTEIKEKIKAQFKQSIEIK